MATFWTAGEINLKKFSRFFEVMDAWELMDNANNIKINNFFIFPP
jgi:hypothetical protein